MFEVGDRVVRKPGFSNAGRYATVLKVSWRNIEMTKQNIAVRFDDNPDSNWSGYGDRFELIGEVEPFEVDE